MTTQRDYEEMSVFEQIKAGLQQSIAQTRGELTLKTTTLPAPAPKISKTKVAQIRKAVGMSQAVFARYLNVPAKTLQSWEQGARQPKAGEARLLQLMESSPKEVVRLIVKGSGQQRSARRTRRITRSR